MLKNELKIFIISLVIMILLYECLFQMCKPVKKLPNSILWIHCQDYIGLHDIKTF